MSYYKFSEKLSENEDSCHCEQPVLSLSKGSEAISTSPLFSPLLSGEGMRERLLHPATLRSRLRLTALLAMIYVHRIVLSPLRTVGMQKWHLAVVFVRNRQSAVRTESFGRDFQPWRGLLAFVFAVIHPADHIFDNIGIKP